MTTLAGITIVSPTVFHEDSYNIKLAGWVSSSLIFDELREQFALCGSTAVQSVPGRRPIGWDATMDCVNTVYILFTTGLKARSGYYLLNSFVSYEDDSTKGLHYYFEAGLTFLGTLAYLTLGYEALDLDEELNDWGI